MPVGRPTAYKPEYCEKVFDLMKIGTSISTVALKLEVHRDTIYEWKEKHPEFSDAIKRGVAASQGWWEEQGRQHLQNPKFNSTLWFMNIKNRFYQEWRDKRDVDLSGSVNLTMSVEDQGTL